MGVVGGDAEPAGLAVLGDAGCASFFVGATSGEAGAEAMTATLGPARGALSRTPEALGSVALDIGAVDAEGSGAGVA